MNIFTNSLAAVNWITTIIEGINKILPAILAIALSVGMIYAVVVGILMIKADSKDKRDENKQRLINIAITIVAVIALIAIFYALRAWVQSGGTEDIKTYVQTESTTWFESN